MASVFIDEYGAYLHRDGGELVVEAGGVEKGRVRFDDMESLVIVVSAAISSAVVEEVLRRGIESAFVDGRGNLVGRLQPTVSPSSDLRRRQFRLSDDQAFRLGIGRSVVSGKVANTRAFLLRMARKRESRQLSAAASELDGLLERIAACEGLEPLLGLEGIAARTYFGVFADMLLEPDKWPFDGRGRRPPPDAVNSLLSFCYALLENAVWSGVVAAGLDPHEGFYHAPGPGRPSLVLDLMEELRPVIADSCVVYMLNRGSLTPEHFASEGEGVYLTEEGRAIVFRAFHRRLRGKVQHPDAPSPVETRRVCHLQALRLARAVRLGEPNYTPFVVR